MAKPKTSKRSSTRNSFGHIQKKGGYRSGFEQRVARQLLKQAPGTTYEPFKVEFTQPAKKRRYTPDFVLPNGIIIEVKGRFTSTDRQKHLFIREDKPELDIRFVFQNPNARIGKKSKTTYAMWCEKHGFLFAKGSVPEEWINL